MNIFSSLLDLTLLYVLEESHFIYGEKSYTRQRIEKIEEELGI